MSGVVISLLAGRPRSTPHPAAAVPADRQHALSAAGRPVGRRLRFAAGSHPPACTTISSGKETANTWVTHTYEVLIELQLLASILQEAETAQRDYLLTGEEQLPRSLPVGSRAEQPVQRVSLRRLTADNPGQKPRLDALDRLVEARFVGSGRPWRFAGARAPPAPRPGSHR